MVLGYVLVRLRQLGVGEWAAIGWAAGLRGSYHLYQGIGGFVGNFAMGLLFGWLYRRWGRVTPLVVTHFLLDVGAFVGYAVLAGQRVVVADLSQPSGLVRSGIPRAGPRCRRAARRPRRRRCRSGRSGSR